MTVKLLKLPEVIKRTTLPRTRLLAQIKGGTFPPPINLGGRAVAWIAQEVEEWIAGRVEEARHNAVQVKQEVML
jgi:prophage regulatory protein